MAIPGPRLSGLLLALALAGCQTPPAHAPRAPRASVVVEEVEPWRQVASPRDSAALDALRGRWQQALSAARAAGLSRRVAAERELLDPAAALPRAAPAPGTYRCRSVRLGGRRWAASAQGFCYVGVEAGELSLATELRGARFGGYLWEPKTRDRLVFLGAAVAPKARAAAAYGDDPALDTAGLLERIGDFRYRLTLIDPAPGSGLTVVELVAAPGA